jgi:hypothetical protein
MYILVLNKVRKASDFIKIVQNFYFLFHNARYINILKCYSSKACYVIYTYINYYMLNRTYILVNFCTLRAGP